MQAPSRSFAIIVAFVAAPLTLSAQAQRALTLEDYFRVESASNPAISPDGRWVALVRGYIDRGENQRRSEIWLAPADGSAPATRLTAPAFNSSNPIWSPDGKLLAFTSRRRVPGTEGGGEQNTVWFIALDRPGEAFQIPGVEGAPVFSPDNRWIAFTKATPPPSPPATPSSSPFEREISQRFRGRMYDWMGYRFDGRGYLADPRDPNATPPAEVYLVPREGGTPRQLTRQGVDAGDVAWRPDSRALVFTADAYQRDEYTYERSDLWVVDLEGQVRRLTDDGYQHTTPAWSPDGRFIVFRRQMGLSMVIAAKQSNGAAVDVYRVPAGGGPIENLTAAWDLLPGEPVPSPDGGFVYFSAGIGGDAHLFRVGVAGGPVEQVTTGSRRLSAFSFTSAFDRMAYGFTDATHPAEVFAARIDGSAEQRLTGFNDALVREVRLAGAERLRYRSKDGTEVEGWLVLPAGYDPARGRSPLILSIHGGPHGAYGNDFSFQFQLWAANGYGVVYTNPRGSTGYGDKFLWATWGGWGNLDSDDVLAGVDHALQRYAFDPARVAVTGYSYGGFLTDWLITPTPRFVAAVSGAGISNWVSDYGTADIPRTKESEFFGAPWEKRGGELLLKQSPIMHAAGVRTPTLFVHGETDFRVPIEQAEQMYTALRKQRVEAKFVRYPDSYHGGWTPWNTVHRYDQELKWWERFLKSSRETVSPD
jgi:dipeptidyl aminopeptidase/acylaminoacyl peptidase